MRGAEMMKIRQNIKRKIIQFKCFFVVITHRKIIRPTGKLSQDDHIIGNKGEEQFAVLLAYAFGLCNAALLIFNAVQVIQRSKHKHYETNNSNHCFAADCSRSP